MLVATSISRRDEPIRRGRRGQSRPSFRRASPSAVNRRRGIARANGAITIGLTRGERRSVRRRGRAIFQSQLSLYGGVSDGGLYGGDVTV